MLDSRLRRKQPFLWVNPAWQQLCEHAPGDLDLDDVRAAERKLEACSALLAALFPELVESGGLIESPVFAADALQQSLDGVHQDRGRWLIKGDHALPIAGSIKARGGFYEVLTYADGLARQHGVGGLASGSLSLLSPEAKALFGRHQVAVGSTGNLGLSIGIMAAALGFRAVVHMSADAKEWKKARLREKGVEVIEHDGDFGAAVAAGRRYAAQHPATYFVDDENSPQLFLGYSVAALRLQRQLSDLRVEVGPENPLFVYLPCGVGGAPGGIAFGLRHVFGDHVHCFFAEPVAAPAMLVRLASGEPDISIYDVGLDNCTEADGLAVGRASAFVAELIAPFVSGIFTVKDADLFEDLYRLERTQGLRVEPSAVAGFRGPLWLVDSDEGHRYLTDHSLTNRLSTSTHVLWTTGGASVPEAEYRAFHDKGRLIFHAKVAGDEPALGNA